MFEEFEDLADNVEDEEDVDQSTSPVEQVDQTKAFATRLKEEKAKAKEEAKNELLCFGKRRTWGEQVVMQTILMVVLEETWLFNRLMAQLQHSQLVGLEVVKVKKFLAMGRFKVFK